MQTVKRPRFEDFHIEYGHGMWHWLGDGETKAELEAKKGSSPEDWAKVVPWVRKRDTSWRFHDDEEGKLWSDATCFALYLKGMRL